MFPIKLSIHDLSAGYGNQTVIQQLSLSVKNGEFLSLLGPSGCGKTTLMKTIAGILPAQQGKICLDGVDITNLPIHQRHTVIVFQDMRLFPHLSIEENVAFPLKMQGVSKQERLERAAALLEKVQLHGFEKRKPHELSGGQQQRTALARALAAQPKLLLLDEPFSALDENLREEMRRLVLDLKDEFQMTVILVTHDRQEALSMSDRIALMFSGRLVQTGTPAQIYNKPTSRTAADYFGDCVYLDGRIEDGWFHSPGLAFPLTEELLAAIGTIPQTGPSSLMLRPSSLFLSDDGDYPLTVEKVSFHGATSMVSFRDSTGHRWQKSVPHPCTLRPGDCINASLDFTSSVFFPMENQSQTR